MNKSTNKEKHSENSASVEQQKENILKLNPDLVFGVYNINTDFKDDFKLQNGESSEKIKLQLLGNTLACYPNQLSNLRGLEDNSSVLIIDLNELRKGKFKILAGNKHEDIILFRKDGSYKTIACDDIHTMNVSRNLCLLSNGVIEFIDSPYKDENQNTQKRTHTFTSLRDGGAADVLQRTCVAGRNYTDNLVGDLETEHTEENPFLQLIDGKYHLLTPKRKIRGGIRQKLMGLLKNREEIISDLTSSVNNFLENKYNLDRNNPNDLEFIKIFERNFKGIKYEKLGEILKDIIENKRIDFFDTEEVTEFVGLENDIKIVEITDMFGKVVSRGKFFVYYDKTNNTFEYRRLSKMILPKGVNPRQRLFLESENQEAKTHRLDGNLLKINLVPMMRYFANKINGIT